MAHEGVADGEHGRGDHGLQEVRDAEAEGQRRSGERDCDAGGRVWELDYEFPGGGFAGERADEWRSEVASGNAGCCAVGAVVCQRGWGGGGAGCWVYRVQRGWGALEECLRGQGDTGWCDGVAGSKGG